MALLRAWTSLLAGVLVASLIVAAAFATGVEAQEPGRMGQVVLDAGHGETNSGTVNARSGLKEEQTLIIVMRLEALLEVEGHAVCMACTRD